METRANFILIGVFTLAAILGTLGFFLWLASVQIDRQYATYGILFDDVSGLSASGDVQFNGISVGKVIDLRIHRPDPSKVFVAIEIDATTPVRTDTVAQLTSQGVTGVAYIALSGGTPEAQPLTARAGELPIIASRRSTVQTLVEDAPDLLAQASDLLDQLKALTGPRNQGYVANILRNVNASSERLDQALSDFSAITGTVADATEQITRFTDRLETIGEAVESTLASAETALASADTAFMSADTVLKTSGAAVESAGTAFAEATVVMQRDVPALLEQVTAAVTSAIAAVDDIRDRSGRTLDGFEQTATLLNLRLNDLERTMSDANAALAAVTRASDSADRLITDDGTELLVDARRQLAAITERIDSLGAAVQSTLTRTDGVLESADGAFVAAETALDASAGTFDEARIVLQNDIPALLGQVSTAVGAVETAVVDLQGKSGRTLDGFEQTAILLNLRLTELERTMLDANTAFAAVTEASDSFDLLVDGDGTLMVAEARAVLADTKTAIATVQAVVLNDVPAVVTDIRAAVATAAETVDRVADDLTGLTGRLEPMADDAAAALQSASALFERSQTTLTVLDRTLAGAETALGSAERTFDAATGVIETDLDPVLADIRTASARIADAVDKVTRDVPAIAADLRALIARSDEVVAQVQAAVASAAPGIGEFARTGLPELGRLGLESRQLVSALEAVVRRIERDPAKFLLGDRVPDYRK